MADRKYSDSQSTAAEREPVRSPALKKKAGNQRLTFVLAVVLVVVALAGLLVATAGRDVPQDYGTVEAAAVDAGVASAAASGADVTDGGVAVDNAWCRSYVFSRCNVMGIAGADCVSISRTGAAVPVDSGVAGCRGAVDAALAEAAGIKSDADAVSGDGDATAAAGEERQVASGSSDRAAASSRDVIAGAAPAEVAKKGPDPEVNAAGIARIRQLMNEIDVARNTYTGTQIGVQTRLDEIREIAAGLDTDEAKQMYNNLIERLGRAGRSPSGGNAAGSVSGPEPVRAAAPTVDSVPQAVQAVPTTAVEAAPTSF